MAQDTVVQATVFDDLPDTAREWAETRLAILEQEHELSRQRSLFHLARVILALGAHGEVVFIGRGAGNILPSESTLHVRLVAPLQDRVAYMSQWLRLNEYDAALRVRARDERRAEFLTSHLRRDPSEVHQYDLLLNSSFLGEDACVTLIAQAVRVKRLRVRD